MSVKTKTNSIASSATAIATGAAASQNVTRKSFRVPLLMLVDAAGTLGSVRRQVYLPIVASVAEPAA